ncbi:beta-ketoacyl-[acyl-carrier-protein] synthase family protein [Rariglobus hedericola]|uniref:3-oxoacyl-[acyl-carrier-protein] synthase 1 n=1 Tax=Rariglobus hedericola TaxID=2597822 RepID=A0A556QN89_9BACT|nr:beta-ketoacyl-[acyl-carrier-protein] synthase family protein [Rariglobus hedericola]TSJ78111.1 beta-ketoacyl-[acyl-carrier-protein] synthase family protein [Rariglobus hedericola]
MSRSVLITGLGFITSIGNDAATVSESLRSGRGGMALHPLWDNPNIPVKVAAPVRDFTVDSPSWRDWSWPARYDVPRETLRSLAPHGVYAFCAMEQALADAGLTKADLGNGETGLFCASAGSAFMLHHHLAHARSSNFERGNPMGVVTSIAGTLNFNLAAHYGITGAVAGFVSACASSSHAIGYAIDEIRLGRQERMIVVGAEELNADTLLPFAPMRALSLNTDPATASRPFDTARDGFVGTGGAVVLIIEEASLARRRGATPYAELIGWGQASDGHSVAISHPEGAGLREAMKRALRDAGVTPGQIDYINAHATSTPIGDRAEAIALRTVFTDTGASPVVSSTKGLTGHGLSMAGAMEAGFCALALREGFMPGNAHLSHADETCAGLNLPRETLSVAPSLVLNNSSGFGGSNVCHVLRRI